MFEAVLRLFRRVPLASDVREVPRYMGQACFNCVYFDYCDPDDIDESDGYCGVNFAHDPHAEYGSWVRHDDWCKDWKEAGAAEMLDRRAERALALRKAADAVDPSASSTGTPSTRVQGSSVFSTPRPPEAEP